jgi:hypothetical protein
MAGQTYDVSDIETDVDAIMCLHEGICPACGHEAEMAEVGGLPDWFLQHIGRLDPVYLVQQGLPYGRILEQVQHSTVISVPGTGNKEAGVPRFYELERTTEVTFWQAVHDADGRAVEMMDVGVFMYKCAHCSHKYETYNGKHGDWTLGGTGPWQAC